MNNLPDSFKGLRALWRLVKKLAGYLGSGFLQCVRASQEGDHDIFLFANETRCKYTERSDVP